MAKRLCRACVVLALLFAFGGLAVAGPVMDDILKRGELVVGITGEQPPLNATAKGGELIGLDADIAQSIAQGMNLKVRFSKMHFQELLPAVQSGKVDLIVSGMTMTSERNTKVAFVGPYYVSGKGILLSLNSSETLEKDGLNSEKFRVAALKGSTSQAIVEKAAPKAKLALVDSYEKAIAMLLEDQADGVIADYSFCVYTASRYSEKGLVVGETKLTVEPLGIAVREDPLLVNALENHLKTLVLSGEMDSLQEKWFKSRSWFEQLP